MGRLLGVGSRPILHAATLYGIISSFQHEMDGFKRLDVASPARSLKKEATNRSLEC